VLEVDMDFQLIESIVSSLLDFITSFVQNNKPKTQNPIRQAEEEKARKKIIDAARVNISEKFSVAKERIIVQEFEPYKESHFSLLVLVEGQSLKIIVDEEGLIESYSGAFYRGDEKRIRFVNVIISFVLGGGALFGLFSLHMLVSDYYLERGFAIETDGWFVAVVLAISYVIVPPFMFALGSVLFKDDKFLKILTTNLVILIIWIVLLFYFGLIPLQKFIEQTVFFLVLPDFVVLGKMRHN
jgi:hypothetical protein